MSVDIATLAIVVDSSQVIEAARHLDELGQAGGRLETAAGKAGSAVSKIGSRAGSGGSKSDDILSDASQAVAKLQALVDGASAKVKEATGGVKAMVDQATGFVNQLTNLTKSTTKLLDIKAQIDGIVTSVEKFNKKLDGLKTAFDKLVQKAGDLPKAIGGLFSDAKGASAFQGAVEAIGGTITRLIPTAFTGAGAMEALGVAVDIATGPFGLILAAIGLVAGALFLFKDTTVTVGGQTGTVGEFIKGTWILIQQTIGNVVGKIVDGLTNFGKIAGEIFGVFRNLVSGVMSKVSDVVGPVMGAVGKFIGDAFTNVLGVVKGYFNFQINSFIFIGEAAKILALGLFNYFKTAFANIGNLARSLGASIVAAMHGDFGFKEFQQALSRQAAPLGEIFDGLKTKAAEIYSTDQIDKLAHGVGGLVTGLATASLTAARAAADVKSVATQTENVATAAGKVRNVAPPAVSTSEQVAGNQKVAGSVSAVTEAQSKRAKQDKDTSDEIQKSQKVVDSFIASTDRATSSVSQSELQLHEQAFAEALAAAAMTLNTGRVLEAEQAWQLHNASLHPIAIKTNTDALQAAIPVLKEMKTPQMEAAEAADQVAKAATRSADAAGRLKDAFDGVKKSVSSVATAIKNQDWSGAVKGIEQAIADIRKAYDEAGLGGAIGAVAGAVAPYAGKVGGSALNGVAGGASLGFSLGGAPGAAVGAVVGGVAGLIGGLLGSAARQTQAAIDAAKAATKTAQDAQGTGTILGDISAKSDSIAKALDLANSTSTKNLGYASEMTAHLRSIDSGINSVSALLARQLGATAGGLFDTSGLGIGSTSKNTFGGLGTGSLLGGAAGFGIGSVLGLGVTSAASAAFGTLLAPALAMSINGIGALFGPIGLGIGLLVGALTKTKVTNTVTDQGLQFTPATIGDIGQSGIQGKAYTDIQSIIKTSLLGIGLSTKTKMTTVFTDLSDDFTKQVDLIVGNLAGTVLDAANTLGVQGAEETIKAFNVDLGKISLDGLKGDDLTKAISAVFSTFADNLAAAVAPIISDPTLQKVGEGAFETLTRLAIEYQAVDDILASMGKTFDLVGVSSIKARDALVQAFGGMDKFASAVSYFTDNFFTDAEKFDINSKQLNQNLSYLADKYGDQSIKALKTADDFKAYVLSIDDTTDAGAALEAAMLALAPAFKAVADYVPTIADAVASLTAADFKWVNDTVQAAVDAAQAANEKVAQHDDQAKANEAAVKASQTSAQAAADAYKSLSDNIDASVPGLLKAGDVMGALAQQVTQVISNPQYDRHMWTFSDGSYNNEGQNNDLARQRAAQAKVLLGQVDAISLSVPNAASAMKSLVDVYNQQFSTEFNHWLPAIQKVVGYDYTNAKVDGHGGVIPPTPIMQNVEGLISSALYRGVSQGLSGAPALPGLYAALDNSAFVSAPGYDGRGFIGQDVNDYHQEIDHLNTEFAQGAITFEAMTSAIKKVNDFVGPDFIKFANDAAAQLARAQEAAQAVVEAGAAQIAGVFGQITSHVAELDAASQAANDNLAQVSNALSRVKNEAELLSDGARYASGSDANQGLVDKANLIATAAGLAAQVLTTQDAANAAKELAKTTAFAGVNGTALRDTSLLLDGLKAYDADSFSNAFDRINAALIRGSVTQDQYTTLVDAALDTFQGLDDVVSKVTDAFKDLADELRLDDTVSALSGPQKLAEAQRQYDMTLVRAATGDADALSGLAGVTKTYLGLAKDFSTSASDYAVHFGMVQADLRTLPDLAPQLTHARLGDAGAATSADIQGLRADLNAALRAIAANTGKTARNTDDLANDGVPRPVVVT